jgi:hypothetical protein
MSDGDHDPAKRRFPFPPCRGRDCGVERQSVFSLLLRMAAAAPARSRSEALSTLCPSDPEPDGKATNPSGICPEAGAPRGQRGVGSSHGASRRSDSAVPCKQSAVGVLELGVPGTTTTTTTKRSPNPRRTSKLFHLSRPLAWWFSLNRKSQPAHSSSPTPKSPANPPFMLCAPSTRKTFFRHKKPSPSIPFTSLPPSNITALASIST